MLAGRIFGKVTGMAGLMATLLAGSATAATIAVPADHATVTAALAAANPGDVIEIAAGTYSEAALISINKNNIRLQASGGAVTLRAPSGAEAVVRVESNITSTVLQGITVDRPTADANWQRCVQLSGDSTTQFIDCNFAGPANGVGVILFNSADASFTGCTFGNFNPAANWAGAIALEGNTGTGFSDITVEDSLFDTGCNRWIASTGATVPKIGRLTFRGNTCNAANGPRAIYLQANIPYDATQPLLFEDCTLNGTSNELAELFYTNAGGPQSVTFREIRINAYNSLSKIFWYDVPAPTVFENVLIAGGKHQTLLRVWGGPPSVNFFHCTFVNDGVTTVEGVGGVAGSTFIDGWDGGRTFVVRNSLFHSPTAYTAGFVGDAGSGGTRTYDITHSIVDHATPSGSFVALATGTNYSNAAPLFTSEGTRDYSLAPDSPGLGEGTELGYTRDALGAPRPLPEGTEPDIGALESVLVPVELSLFEIM